jgi:hypothetical protein
MATLNPSSPIIEQFDEPSPWAQESALLADAPERRGVVSGRA